MKKSLSVLLALLLALALCACGGTQEEAAPAGDAPTATEPAASAEPGAPAPAAEKKSAADSEMESVLPDAGLHEAAPGADPELAARIEKAKSFLDKDVSALIAELGEPLSRDYAPSCLGPGEDGELQYEGFTVYTYREAGQETVTDVD